MLHVTTTRVIKFVTQLESAARLVVKRPVSFSIPLSPNPHMADKMSADLLRIASEWLQLQRDEFSVASIHVGVHNKRGHPHDQIFQRDAELIDAHDLDAYYPEQFPLHFTEDKHHLLIVLVPE